ncbi:hypothetical protein G6553_14245 [Nocardioides sp. IC4_145]|uniref:purine-cytosine permease family protein n=1 Tax=Nocardioides sp. IC4_145 TaxID=2714037 RepID=UPI00140C5313|nr:cytosine permease [Nocardioides sp. IC4_145]NHC24327.1 hypothetical protein [Nocardioides sp. IC4_145]
MSIDRNIGDDRSVAAREEAVQNGFPQPRDTRTWGPRAIFGTSVSTAIATWCFLIGGFAAYYLPAVEGTLAIIAGSLVGILFIVLACLPVCSKYGIDSVTASRPQFGTRGSVLSMVLIFASTLGWNVILFILLGRATASILGAFGASPASWVVNVAGVLAALVVFAILARGSTAVRDFSQPIAIGVLLLGALVLGLLVRELGLEFILDAEPVYAWPDAKVNWASAIEVLVASNLSWWAYTGAMVRNSPSARQSLWPVVIGLGLGVGLGSLTGLYAALAIPDSGGDPTQFMVDVSGPVVGVIVLAFIILANIGTAVVGVYASVIALRQLPVISKTSWRTSVAIAVLPAIVLVGFFASPVFGRFSTFLAFLGVCFGPVCGIQVVDYFILRKQRLDVAALYDDGPGTAYRYWGGVNPVGLVAFGAGVATYIYLLDPVTYESRAPFQYLTASLPAFVMAGAIYWLGTKLVLVPLGKGGYTNRHTPASSSLSQESQHPNATGTGSGSATPVSDPVTAAQSPEARPN